MGESQPQVMDQPDPVENGLTAQHLLVLCQISSGQGGRMEINVRLAKTFLLGLGAQALPGHFVQKAKPAFGVFDVEEDIRVCACKQQGIAGIELAVQALTELCWKARFRGCRFF